MKNIKEKPLRFGIVGTNFISEWFISEAKRVSGVEITSVYSRKSDTGNAFAGKHGIGNVYTNYKDMLSSGNIDAVYIASPTVCHCEQAREALALGIPALTEKMITVSYEELLELSETAERTDAPLAEAMRPLYDPAYDKIRALIPRLGKLTRANFEYLQYSSRYDKFKAGIIENAFDPEMKNSALADIGIYPLSMAIALFGEPCDSYSHSRLLKNGFEGEGHITLDYGSFSASVSYSKIRGSSAPSVIAGERGYIAFDRISAPRHILLHLYSESSAEEYTVDEPILNMSYEIAAFRDMCRGVSNFREKLSHTAAVMRIVDKVYADSGIFG